MKKILLALLIGASAASACITPIQPIPPIGCSSSNAVLMTASDGTCHWVFIGCN